MPVLQSTKSNGLSVFNIYFTRQTAEMPVLQLKKSGLSLSLRHKINI
jgi:hypothetical protein